MVEIKPFKPEHWDVFEPRPIDVAMLDADPQSKIKLEHLARYGYCGSIIHDGRIIGIIGYVQLHPGVVEVLAFPSKYVDRYSMVYLRTCRKYLKIVEDTINPHRFQTTSIADALHDR